MHILINEQKIEITGYPKVQRFNNDGHLLLTVNIPKENLTATEIDALCVSIRETAPVIEVYENDEKVQTMTGFKLYPIYKPSKDFTTWELYIENSSESDYQYGLLKDRADALEKANAALVKANTDQAAVIESLNQQLLMVQLAAAELYEKSLAAEEVAEEPVESTEPEAAESEAE